MLLATFTTAGKVRDVIEIIETNFTVVNGTIFILKDTDQPWKRVLTFNVEKSDRLFSDVLRNTVSLHRKKGYDCLYTINALNEVVKLQNEGKADPSFSVNWENFRNCILLTKRDDLGENQLLKKINTALVRVVRL